MAGPRRVVASEAAGEDQQARHQCEARPIPLGHAIRGRLSRHSLSKFEGGGETPSSAYIANNGN